MYIDLVDERLSNKFKKANNLKQLIRIALEPLDELTEKIDTIRQAKNITSDYDYSLDLVGYLMGVHRPILPKDSSEFFHFDSSTMDNENYPLFDYSAITGTNTSPATNELYRSFLNAIRVLSNFESTIEEAYFWFDNILGNDFNYSIDNQQGHIIISFNETTTLEQRVLIEQSLKGVNFLTTSYSLNYN